MSSRAFQHPAGRVRHRIGQASRRVLIVWACAAGIAGAGMARAGTAAGLAGGAGEESPSEFPAVRAKRRVPHRPSLPLPATVRGWTRPDTVRLVQPESLFDYMDGGAELYLGYRLRYLEVCSYSHADEDEIVVELFRTETSDDAYGLLSLDWTGERVDLPAAADTRALYEGGLLRLWSDDVYARVMTYRETEASRAAVGELARAIDVGRPHPSPPSMVAEFPRLAPSRYKLVTRPSLFRSHVALNSVYRVSYQDLLDLGASALGMIGSFAVEADSSAAPVYVALVRYARPENCRRGLAHFRRAYLPPDAAPDAAAIAPTEQPADPDEGLAEKDGRWVGFTRQGRGLALVFAAPDESTTRLFLQTVQPVLRGIADEGP
jgi:hypothetical protein